jgi:archaellin
MFLTGYSLCSPQKNTTSATGFVYRIAIDVDLKAGFNKINLQELLQTANDITAKAANIHLQITNIVLYDDRQDKLFIDHLSNRAKQSYDIHPYDAHIIMYNGRIRRKISQDAFCSRQSHSWFQISQVDDQADIERTSRNLASVIIQSILSQSTVNALVDKRDCSCPDYEETRYCLDRANDTFDSQDVTNCYKKVLEKLDTSRETDDPNLEGHKFNISCLYSEVNFNQTWKGQLFHDENYTMSLLYNGIVEGDEECDCFMKDNNCGKRCKDGRINDSAIRSTSPTPPKSENLTNNPIDSKKEEGEEGNKEETDSTNKSKSFLSIIIVVVVISLAILILIGIVLYVLGKRGLLSSFEASSLSASSVNNLNSEAFKAVTFDRTPLTRPATQPTPILLPTNKPYNDIRKMESVLESYVSTSIILPKHDIKK